MADHSGQGNTAGAQQDHRKLEKERKEKLKRMSKVEVAAEDVAIIMHELELTKKAATILLKENDGSLEKTLDAYLTV